MTLNDLESFFNIDANEIICYTSIMVPLSNVVHELLILIFHNDDLCSEITVDKIKKTFD